MRIAIVDYIGYTSIDGLPIGHGLKALRETAGLLEGFDLEIIAPQAYIREIQYSKTKILPGNVVVNEKKDKWFRNIKRALLEFRNIYFAFQNYEADYLWFYNIDQFFFLYCFLMRVPLNNTVITAFVSEYPKKYHNYCFMKCLEKLRLAVLTNLGCKYRGINSVHMPDYLYDPDVYDKYKCSIRKEKILCLGVMNPSKRIMELVETFHSIDYPLEIHGYFPDKEYCKYVNALKQSHIEIIDEYIDYEEMLQLIGSVKYVIFPYNMAVYADTTSGILLECVFLGAIPIAPSGFLEKYGFEGLNLEAINTKMLANAYVEIKEHNDFQIKRMYSVDRYRSCIRERLLQKETI